MKTLLKRDFSCAPNRSLFFLVSGTAAEGNTIKEIYIDKNKVPHNVYDFVFDKTGILFKYDLSKNVVIEAELE